MADPGLSTRATSPERGELLVVDDEQILRDAVAASLRFLGHGVANAGTGSDALRQLAIVAAIAAAHGGGVRSHGLAVTMTSRPQ